MSNDVVNAGQQLPPPTLVEPDATAPAWGAPTPSSAATEPAETVPVRTVRAEAAKRKGLSTTARVLLLVCGSVTVLGYGLSSLEANEQRSAPPVVDFPVRSAGESPVELNELGVDPAGNLAAGFGQGAVVFTDAQGLTWEAIFDSSSGATVSTLRSPGAGRPPIRFDVSLTPGDVVPTSLDAYVVSASTVPAAEGEIVTLIIDVERLRTDDPSTLASWALGVGLAAADLGLIAGETVGIDLLVDDDGTVRSFVLQAEATIQRVTYVRTPASK